jgi:hypothetical protein
LRAGSQESRSSREATWPPIGSCSRLSQIIRPVGEPKTMIQERRQSIENEKKRWLDLAEELSNIISYVSANLAKIEALCEHSIEVLVNEQVDRKKEIALIEDIKEQFKMQLKGSLYRGTIRNEDLEAAKEKVATLSKVTADLVRSDIYAFTQLYETVHGHAKKIMQELRNTIVPAHENYDEDLRYYLDMEKLLVSLVSDCRFDVKIREITADADHSDLLLEKRRQMFDHLVEVLENA